jgi:hypothetical protein
MDLIEIPVHGQQRIAPTTATSTPPRPVEMFVEITDTERISGVSGRVD